MASLFDDLKQGLQEAIRFAEGTGTAKTNTLTSDNNKMSPIGDSWEDVKKELFTPKEIVDIESATQKLLAELDKREESLQTDGALTINEALNGLDM